MKEHQAMIDAVKRGDTIVTTGGIVGKVVRVTEGELRVEIANNVQIQIVKSAISEVRTKGEPVREAEEKPAAPAKGGKPVKGKPEPAASPAKSGDDEGGKQPTA